MICMMEGRLAGGGGKYKITHQNPPRHPAEESAIRAVALLPQEPLGNSREVLPWEIGFLVRVALPSARAWGQTLIGKIANYCLPACSGRGFAYIARKNSHLLVGACHSGTWARLIFSVSFPFLRVYRKLSF